MSTKYAKVTFIMHYSNYLVYIIYHNSMMLENLNDDSSVDATLVTLVVQHLVIYIVLGRYAIKPKKQHNYFKVQIAKLKLTAKQQNDTVPVAPYSNFYLLNHLYHLCSLSYCHTMKTLNQRNIGDSISIHV